MVALPLAKLAAVAIKQISKPVASWFQVNARNHPNFRKTCITVAQSIHRVEQWTIRSFYGMKSDKVLPLNEEKAVETGAQLLGEVIIFSMAVAILLGEYKRSSLKEAEKELRLRAELNRLQVLIDQLQDENDRIIKKVFPKSEYVREEIPERENKSGGIIPWLTSWVRPTEDLEQFPARKKIPSLENGLVHDNENKKVLNNNENKEISSSVSHVSTTDSIDNSDDKKDDFDEIFFDEDKKGIEKIKKITQSIQKATSKLKEHQEIEKINDIKNDKSEPNKMETNKNEIKKTEN